MDSYLLAANNILFKATLAPSFISSDTEGSGYSRESVVVGGITATIFLLCCLTIAFTLNYSKDVDKCEEHCIDINYHVEEEKAQIILMSKGIIYHDIIHVRRKKQKYEYHHNDDTLLINIEAARGSKLSIYVIIYIYIMRHKW